MSEPNPPIDLTSRRPRLPEKKAVPWDDMTLPQKFVVTTLGIGVAAIFLSICAALSAHVLRWAAVI